MCVGYVNKPEVTDHHHPFSHTMTTDSKGKALREITAHTTHRKILLLCIS